MISVGHLHLMRNSTADELRVTEVDIWATNSWSSQRKRLKGSVLSDLIWRWDTTTDRLASFVQLVEPVTQICSLFMKRVQTASDALALQQCFSRYETFLLEYEVWMLRRVTQYSTNVIALVTANTSELELAVERNNRRLCSVIGVSVWTFHAEFHLVQSKVDWQLSEIK